DELLGMRNMLENVEQGDRVKRARGFGQEARYGFVAPVDRGVVSLEKIDGFGGFFDADDRKSRIRQRNGGFTDATAELGNEPGAFELPDDIDPRLDPGRGGFQRSRCPIGVVVGPAIGRLPTRQIEKTKPAT